MRKIVAWIFAGMIIATFLGTSYIAKARAQPNQETSAAIKELEEKAQAGDVDAQGSLGLMYYNGLGVKQDYKEALKWYNMAAEQGNALAQLHLGLIYNTGRGMKQDYKEAAKWYRKAAEQGDAEAQWFLGGMYRFGRGVEQDYQEAVKWYRKAAEQGFAAAQSFLGSMYSDGQGVEQDYQEAVKWYHKAAEQGFAIAQYSLGFMYYKGQGVIEDYIEAYKWLLLAGMNGKDVNEVKEILSSRMSRAQIAEAQRLARAFVPKEKSEKRVEAANRPDELKSMGTAFFIYSGGYLLTANHVVEDAETIKVQTVRGFCSATVLMADAVSDIAILKVGDKGFETLPLTSSSAVRTGDKVFTVGFPNIELQGKEPKYTEGVISSLSGIVNNPRYFQISTPLQPGNSGGPLVSEKGYVVGIVSARLDDINTMLATGTLPQNVNYAIKSSFVLPFLEVVPGLSSAPDKVVEDKTLNRTVLIERAKNAVALVLCY